MTDPTLDSLTADLRDLNLLRRHDVPEFVPLTGGVASDIWLVRTADKTFVVKRALEKMRVAADWRAPVSRNASEVAWLAEANKAVPGSAPTVLAQRSDSGFFAMTYLAPENHPVWKRELHAGRADPAFASIVGANLATIHALTAGRPEIASRFNDDAVFRAIRLEPYLEFTAARHPQLARVLIELSARTLNCRRALVHGDVSPKNILVGPSGPVFLDAECAWYGDPAFDLAFCLNHLLLKCLWTPAATADFLRCFDALSTAYLSAVTWEPRDDLEARVGALLPPLLLARIDGKSPVEYITDAGIKQHVRDFACPLIANPAHRLSGLRTQWASAITTWKVPP